MTIVGGLDIHREQLTFDYLGTVAGEAKGDQIAPADWAHPPFPMHTIMIP